MAVGFDAATEFPTTQSAGASNTLTLSWNHIPVTSTPKGVGLFVTYSPSSLTTVTTVKYGGVALSKVASAIDTVTEPGVMEFWYLGTGVPTGTQAFNVVTTLTGAGMWGAGITVSASFDTTVSQFLTVQENNSLGEVTLSTIGVGTRFAGAYYGGAAPPGVGANSTTVFDIDYGAYGARVVRETTAGSGNRVVGFAAGTGDDVAAIYVAIDELIPDTTVSASGLGSGLAFGSITLYQDIEFSLSASVPPGYKYTVLNNPELSANWSIGSSYGSTLSTSDIVIFKEFAFRDGSTATYSVTISTNGRVFVNSGADSSSYTVEYFLWDEETSLYGTTRTFAVIQSLVTALTVSAVGKASDLAFGTLVLQARNTVTPSGKATDAAFGTASLIARSTVFPNGLASNAAFGTLSLQSRITVSPVAKDTDGTFGAVTVYQDIEYSLSASVPPGYKYTVLLSPERSADWSLATSYGSTLSTSDIVVFKKFAFRNGSTATYSVTISTNGRVFVDSGADSSSYTVEYFIWDEETSLYGTTRTFAVSQSAASVAISPTGLASGAAYGTPSVLNRFTVLVSGLGSGEAFGTPTLSTGDVTLSVAGKTSDLAFGTFSVTTGAETTASFSVSATVPPGYKFTILSSPEVSNTYNIGYSLSPTLVTGDIVIFSEWATQNGTTTSYSVTITTAGYPIVDAMSTSGSLSFQYFIWDDSAQSYGSTGTYSMLEFFADQTVYPNDLSSSAAFGTPSLIQDQFIYVNAKDTDASFGTVSLIYDTVVYPNGKGSDVAFGQASLSAKIIVYPNSKGTDEGFGSPSLLNRNSIYPNGLPTSASFGQVVFLSATTIYPNGKATDEAFGTPIVASGVYIRPNSLNTSASFGIVSLTSRLFVYPNGIVTGESFGTPQFGSLAYIYPNSYVQVEAFGQPTFGTVYILNASSVASGFATGVLSLTFDQYIELVGKAYTEFGQFRIYIAGQLVVAGDNIFEWFEDQPSVQGSKLDRLKEYLNSLGYKGSSNSMVFKFLRDNGYKGSLPQMISKFERDFTNRYGPA